MPTMYLNSDKHDLTPGAKGRLLDLLSQKRAIRDIVKHSFQCEDGVGRHFRGRSQIRAFVAKYGMNVKVEAPERASKLTDAARRKLLGMLQEGRTPREIFKESFERLDRSAVPYATIRYLIDAIQKLGYRVDGHDRPAFKDVSDMTDEEFQNHMLFGVVR